MNVTLVVIEFLLLQTVKPLEDFIWQNFNKETIILISSNLDTLDDRLIFILYLPQPKLIIHPKKSPNLEIFNNYIITETNLTSLSLSINSLKYKTQTKGRFLIIPHKDFSEDETKSAFETLWSHYIYNVVIYINWTSFVTWYPYSFENHCGTVFNLMENIKFPYDNKIPRRLQGCSINASWDELALAIKNPLDKRDPGYSVRLLDTVAEKTNANIIYLKRNAKYMSNGIKQFSKWKNELLEQTIDLAFVIKNVPEPLGPEFEMSVSYFETYCFFVLPPRRKITSSTNTLVIFSAEIWSLIAITIIFMTVLLKNFTERSLQHCFFEVIRFMLQSSIKRVPKTTLTRFTFVFFFFYNCNLSWIYVSQLSGVLSKPSYEPKISTIQDLALSNKVLRFNNLWDQFFKGRIFEKEIFEKKISIPDEKNSFKDQLTEFLKNLDHGFINSNSRMHFIKNYEKLHAVSHDKITTLHSHLMFRKAFPFSVRFNDVLLHIIEGGLISKWFDESQIAVEKLSVREYENVEGYLDLDRIICVFVLLGSNTRSLGWNKKVDRDSPSTARSSGIQAKNVNPMKYIWYDSDSDRVKRGPDTQFSSPRRTPKGSASPRRYVVENRVYFDRQLTV
ncbi:hypothetical protein Zmor_017817 [Zophobas morio]|uniref:Uncharacterized protein n=1 Tax=Zophobas morio TaxID=2755281 RepID=A0AA38ID99_9CUCU|nr:hypothetical protein Zmor_017817 [Zophobas morio]